MTLFFDLINRIMDIFSPLVLDSSVGSFSSGFMIREMFCTGLFHGFFFSLPFSIPMLICFRRYLLDGFSLGNYALAGTLLGHLSFVFCTIEGIRPIIYFWYTFEPLLSILGFALSLKVATDFFSQRRFSFDGTLGFSEDSGAYALNPWPHWPKISLETIIASSLPRPLKRFVGKIFFAWDQLISFSPWGNRRAWPEKVRLIFENIEDFFQRNLGPSFFSFQFFLMWLNPASTSTFNLLSLEHTLLHGIYPSPGVFSNNALENPMTFNVSSQNLFLIYTLGFVCAALLFFGMAIVLISQLTGRNFSWATPMGGSVGSPRRDQRSGILNWFKNLKDFDEVLAQNRLKILNKFLTFLMIGYLLQSGVNYSWRLFLQYPLELIHWDLFDSKTLLRTFKKTFGGSNSTGYVAIPSPQTEGFSPGMPSEFLSAPPLARTKNSRSFDFAGALGEPSALEKVDAFEESASKPEQDTLWVLIELQEKFSQHDLQSNRREALDPAPAPGSNLDNLNILENDFQGFYGRREFPPYDTSIKNREKSLPVERHLAIERVNSRRALMGRPPLENEERENAIFKYYTFFINQIDRSVEDLKRKMRTPNDLSREEDDIRILNKLHNNYLKQKGRESAYQKSFLPKKGNSPRIARHTSDFFTKSRPILNKMKGMDLDSEESYLRDFFDENLNPVPNYLHDDILLSKNFKK